MLPGVTPFIFGLSGRTPPLDLIAPSASGAWGLSRLRTAYAGQCIRVRRSSDSTEQDIGFSGNSLDTASMLSFCGAGDGFVVTTYDQSTNARNLTNATAAQQPRIVASGVLETLNGAPAMFFDGSNDNLAGTTQVTFMPLNSCTFIAAGNVTAGGSTVDGGSSYLNPCIMSNTGAFNHTLAVQGTGVGSPSVQGIVYNGNVCSPAYTLSSNAAFLMRHGSSNLKTYVNGGAGETVAIAGTDNGSNLRIGANYNVSAGLAGKLTEFFCFASELSVSDTNIICPNIATSIAATWSNIS
jgi:hypothetical protein